MSLTRIAPTPSGYLHPGNLVNFALTAGVERELSLQLALRIDDIDHERVRSGYIDDIFRVIDWLGMSPKVGPRDASDLAAAWSQSLRIPGYWHALEQMAVAGLSVFACTCSRTALREGRCVAGCGGGLADYIHGETRVRWRAAAEDISLWGHDGRPTYHLTNVVDDRDLGTTHVVRGIDLEPSTAVHTALAAFLPGTRPIRYAHHELLTDGGGAKLSKSQGTLRLDLTEALRASVAERAAALLPGVLAQLAG